jgi:hypothetical protein
MALGRNYVSQNGYLHSFHLFRITDKKSKSKNVAHVMLQCSYPPGTWWPWEYRKETIGNETSMQLVGGSRFRIPQGASAERSTLYNIT